MQPYKTIMHTLQEKVCRITNALSEEQFESAVKAIMAADRVFIQGAGRSGLAGRFFAVRLMHTGKVVYVAGDTTTPALREKDLLILISGSGDTASVVMAAEKGRAAGAVVMALTAKAEKAHESKLAVLCNFVIALPAGTPANQPEQVVLFPMGTFFEVSVLLFLEAAAAAIIDAGQIREADMQARHANLE